MPRSSTTAAGAPARRKRDQAGMTRADLLARHPPGETPPEQVLELLLGQFNLAHTAREKTVSHKTRHERAQFLRRFFRDLRAKAGFATTPDPRNLGNRHILAMVQVWRTERLAPATIQTYLSFLRGLAQWIGKPGLVGIRAACCEPSCTASSVELRRYIDFVQLDEADAPARVGGRSPVDIDHRGIQARRLGLVHRHLEVGAAKIAIRHEVASVRPRILCHQESMALQALSRMARVGVDPPQDSLYERVHGLV